MFAPIVFVISVSIVSTSALSLLLVLVLSILLLFYFFVTWLALSVPGLLAKFLNFVSDVFQHRTSQFYTGVPNRQN